MNKIFIVLICTVFSLGLKAQNMLGAWENEATSENGNPLKTVLIVAKDYSAQTTYNKATGKFMYTKGGSWKLEGGKLTEKIEFHSEHPELVGTESSFNIKTSENTFEITDSNTKFNRIDDGTPGKLQGAWLMSGRVTDGKTQLRDTSGPRKTMKILSGTRFQWIAYHTETKQFMGTGGGTYTTINGDYTENIEFFSRDDSKAGLRLKSNYKLIDGNWNHSGLSSKGDPIHEIWSIRE